MRICAVVLTLRLSIDSATRLMLLPVCLGVVPPPACSLVEVEDDEGCLAGEAASNTPESPVTAKIIKIIYWVLLVSYFSQAKYVSNESLLFFLNMS